MCLGTMQDPKVPKVDYKDNFQLQFSDVLFLKLCPIFVGSALCLFTKYNNFLGACSVLAKNLTSFD